MAAFDRVARLGFSKETGRSGGQAFQAEEEQRQKPGKGISEACL